jgi:hypothetical protein
MPQTKTPNTESAILDRLVRPHDHLTMEAAQAILELDFDPSDRLRMKQLAQLAQDDLLSDEDQMELDAYRRVGRFMDLMRSKARRTLKQLGLATK